MNLQAIIGSTPGFDSPSNRRELSPLDSVSNTDLLNLFRIVIKTTGSAFENFVRDEYTTLAEVNDRIFSTSVNLNYSFKPLSIGAAGEEDLKKIKAESDFDKTAGRAREITLEVFATDESASVQVRRQFNRRTGVFLRLRPCRGVFRLWMLS